MTKLLLFALFSTSAYAVDLEKHPVYAQILHNSPKIDKQYAMKLSNEIYRASVRYKIPKDIFTAILRQESGYKLDAVRKECGLDENMRPKCISTDFSIGQIHWKSVKRYKLDIDKLLTNMSYSINASALILSWFHLKFAHKEQYWFLRYNVGVRKKALKSQAAKEYCKRLNKFGISCNERNLERY